MFLSEEKRLLKRKAENTKQQKQKKIRKIGTGFRRIIPAGLGFQSICRNPVRGKNVKKDNDVFHIFSEQKNRKEMEERK